MRTTAKILAEASFNPNSKQVVVIDGVSPFDVAGYLPNSLIIVQNAEPGRDYPDYLVSSESLLNATKPELFICNNPTDSDIELCGKINCKVLSIKDLGVSVTLTQTEESVVYTPQQVQALQEITQIGEEQHDNEDSKTV